MPKCIHCGKEVSTDFFGVVRDKKEDGRVNTIDR